jgi:hypothetical protein
MRYRFQDQPINMRTGLPAGCKCQPKPATQPAAARRRRIITLAEMNRRNREFWRIQ